MLRDSGQAVVQFPDTYSGGVTQLVKKPEYAVTLDRLSNRELAKRAVAAQQNPGSGLREGEAIGKRKSWRLLPIGKGALYTVTAQLLDGEAKSYQLRADRRCLSIALTPVQVTGSMTVSVVER